MKKKPLGVRVINAGVTASFRRISDIIRATKRVLTLATRDSKHRRFVTAVTWI